MMSAQPSSRCSSSAPSFAVLGPLEIRDTRGGWLADDHGGRRPAPRRSAAREILCLLLLRANADVSVEWIIDSMWPDPEPSSVNPRKYLMECVSRLRRMLGTFTIRTVAGGYRLIVDRDGLDVLRFEHLIERAGDLLDGSRPAPAVDLLSAALALWRGTPYMEFAGRRYRFQRERDRLEHLHLVARVRRMEAQLCGRRAVGEVGLRDLSTELLDDHRHDVCAHELFLQALHRVSHTHAALSHYQTLWARLRGEHREPDPRLQNLYEHLHARHTARRR